MSIVRFDGAMGVAATSCCAPLAPVQQPEGSYAPAQPAPSQPATTAVAPAGGAPADLATVIGQLTEVVGQLQGVIAQLQAQAGAAQVQGGGATAPSTPASGATLAGQAPTASGPDQAPGQAAPPPPPPPPPLAPGAPPTPGQATPPGAPPDATAGQGHPGQEGGVRARLVQIAQGEVGVVESGEDRGERINTYRGAVTGPGEQADLPEPWCADFLSWVYREAGIPVGNDGKGEDYVPYLKDWAQKAGRYHDRGGYQPQPGDIVVFNWDGGPDDHAGIVEKVEGDNVHTIEGNSSDSVARRSYALGSGQVTGYVSV